MEQHLDIAAMMAHLSDKADDMHDILQKIIPLAEGPSWTTMEKVELSLSSSVAAIRKERNSKLPAVRIPAEVLTSIFQHILQPQLCDDYPYDGMERWKPLMPNVIDLLPVIGVCSYWREVALHAPALWRSLTITKVHSPHVQLLLSRSQSLKLLVVDQSAHDFHVSFLPRFKDRLQELHWLARYKLTGILDLSDYPKLEALSLCRYTPARDFAVSFGTGPAKLRRLSLNGTHWSPDISLPNLTYLHLSGYGTREDISHLLSVCPNLEDFVLVSLNPWDRSRPDRYSGPKIELPKLRRVVIENSPFFRDDYHFLSSIASTPTTALRICAYMESLWTPEFVHNLSSLPTWRECTTLVISSHDEKTTMTAMGAEVGVSIPRCSREPERTAASGNLVWWLPNLNEVMSATSIRELWIIDRFASHNPAATEKLLRSLPHLETLVIMDRSIRYLRHVLTIDGGGGPNLRTLHIRLRENMKELPTKTTASGNPSWALALLSSLVKANVHSKFKHLVITYNPKYGKPQTEGAENYSKEFESIIYRRHYGGAFIRMPDVCRRETHNFWPGFGNEIYYRP
ncbi:hypothetical protein WOLCODRAFT_152982 [Wolfiporia cocos MD-104 SS10]|uniref:Uncharacterized protein n=1 Tax=Wolfiporia cocos (strain MD-104) TaxID=742152 RepID=A0A2H3JVJ8_WOLCO|nr:hypothetical protein WOLCODRAFT_152982 [Wolfiporia cocos MD-104 SS10]